MIYPYWQVMVPSAGIYSIQFGFWLPQLHQHLQPHSTYHLRRRTYPLTPDLHWHQYLHSTLAQPVLVTGFKQPLQIKWLHHFVHATLYTITCLEYPLLITSSPLLPFPQIDITGAMVIVWRARGKIIRSVLCTIVCNNCTQWTAHIYEQN